MTDQEKIAALRRWPKVLALSLIGHHDNKLCVTWQEFCKAQDQYEEVICGISLQSPEELQSASSWSGSKS